MPDNPVYPLTVAADLGAGWRYDATGRAFYSAAWLDGGDYRPVWELPHPDDDYMDGRDNPQEDIDAFKHDAEWMADL
jgi:hypothetical protein